MRASLFATILLFACPSSHAAVLVYSAILNGANEAPPNASPATGFVTVTIDSALNTMLIVASFSGLTGNTTAAHIHASTTVPGTGTSGVATQTPSFTGFPLGVTSGTMNQTYDMTLASSFNATYVTAQGGTAALAWTALQSAISNGSAYFNIHTSSFGGGEIRGFLTPVPEPSALIMGLAGAGLALRRRRGGI